MTGRTTGREVCFLIDHDGAILWSDASDHPASMPDSRERWTRIWELRERLAEIAHSHPGGGLHFSSTDEETMAAINAGLGRRMTYSVITPDAMLRRPGETEASADGTNDSAESTGDHVVEAEPWWTALLRSASDMNHSSTEEQET